MSDLEEKIQGLLSSPDGLSQLLEVAQSIGAKEPVREETEVREPVLPNLSGLFDSLKPEQLSAVLSFMEDYQDESDRRFHMLQALREYAKPADMPHLEKAKQIVKLTKVAKHAIHSMRGKENGV
ncbi:MAG: hypothetical protein E7471_02480 [Ruminococcaceae bacterium]|nr:hypothetical protein [Oscillospiraceae bacterium]